MIYYKVYFCDFDNVMDTDFMVVSRNNFEAFCKGKCIIVVKPVIL